MNVHVVIDHQALKRGLTAPGEVCEAPGVGPVDAAWVRAILGDAFVTAIIRRGKDISTDAHLGRYLPTELRTALTVSGRECFIEGCEARGYLEVHHSETAFGGGGITELANLTNRKYTPYWAWRGAHIPNPL